jgi:hypothetical protein
VFCGLPKDIIKEYTTTTNTAAQLSGDKSRLLLEHFGGSGKYLLELIDILRFHSKLVLAAPLLIRKPFQAVSVASFALEYFLL